jgi:hypothetical protein
MPTRVEVYQFTLQAKLEHRRRVEDIIRRGLTGRAFDEALRASEDKRDRAIKKFRDGINPPLNTLPLWKGEIREDGG